ncbi:MAG: S-layer family protein [Candidatus Sulfotelmatobacter sp.]
MRSAFSRAVTLPISVICLLAAFFSFDGLASAQAAAGSKHKLSQQVLLGQSPVVSKATRTAAAPSSKLTTDTWTGTAGDGNWGTAGNWSLGTAPTSSNAVVIGGTNTVNVNGADVAGTLTLSTTHDTLAIENNTNLTVDGNITNNGAITLNSINNGTDLIIGASSTLSGTGTITMSNNGNNFIYGAAGTDVLTVGSGQNISGAGNIGNNSMALSNAGIINATQPNALYIDTSNGTTNTGTLEATAGGTLILYGQNDNSVPNTINNAGGTISAGAGSTVQLTNGIIISGGTLNTSGTGLVETLNGTATLENVTNAGNYVLTNNTQNTLVGTITNNGNISMTSINNGTYFLLSGNVTLSGTGTLTMSNNGNNIIEGVSGAGTEVLTNNINISGAGNIGNSQTILVNSSSGVINANQPTTLTIAPTTSSTAGVTNTGLMEATAGGTLGLNNGTYINAVGSTQGKILANGGTVNLNNGATIVGGTLQSENGGSIQNTGVAALNGSTSAGAVTLVAGTALAVQNNTTLGIQGSIVNNGTLSLNSINNSTYLEVLGAAGSSATLSGTGTLTMSNNGNNGIYGANGSNIFTNEETIQGSGDIGVNSLTFVNKGTVNANQSNALVIQTSNGTTNTGTLEATTTGTLTLSANSITNTGGKIEALGATGNGNGATVNLQNGIVITGGTLTSNAFGAFNEVNTATLSGLTITAGTNVNIENNTALTLQGTIVNSGKINLNSINNNTDLVMNGNVSLNGTGTVNMSNNGNNFIYGAVGADVLTVASTQTIQGAGNVGDNQMTLVNNGTIDGNLPTTLYVQASGGTTNTGTLEATAGGSLSLYGNTVTNTGAGKVVAGSGSTVNLEGNVTVVGGSLTGTGTYVVNGQGGYATLSGLTNASTIQINNNNELNLVGTIVNNGSIQENSSNNNTDLIMQGNVALNGTGTVTMSNNGNNFIYGAAGTDILTVASTQTIQGAGNIGSNQMTLVNNGTIDGNVSNALTIQPSGGTTNTNTLEATAGGTLTIYGNTVTNTGAGKIIAGSGSTVNLEANVTVAGGSLTGTGTFVENGVGGYATLSGLTNASTVQVSNNTLLNLVGTIVNNGQIQENSINNNTDIILATGNVTLSGSGALVMSNNGNNFIYGNSGSYILTNASTIEGAGSIGDNQMMLVNSGTINANDPTALIIQTSGTFDNTGTIEATNTGNLTVATSTANFVNYNSTTSTLTGGNYVANGGNLILPLATGSNGITTLAASATEEGGSQILNSNDSNANALANLTSITSTGALTIGGVAFTDAGSFSNAGSLTILSGESFKVGSLAQISGTTLTAGTYVLDANLNLTGATQNITTNAATVTLAGGTIENANSTSAFKNLATNSGKLTLANGTAFTTVGPFSNTGTLVINTGSSMTLGGAGTLTQISGNTITGGTFVLGGNLNIASGANITTNASTITLEGGNIESGSANALANLASNTKSLTLANNVNFTTVGNFTSFGALTVNNGSTFAVNTAGTDTLTNYHNTGVDANELVGGTYTVGGTLTFNAGLTGAIKVDDANITMEGTGLIENTTTGAASTNALVNLNSISSTGSFTLADGANFTTMGNFTNGNKLTVDAGSIFALTGSNVLTNLASGTLTGGTYTVGGTLQLTSANGGITTNAATLTVTGTTAQILDGTTNALAGFDNNTGSFTLSGLATLADASNTFNNSGTVDIAKGSTITITGTGHSYSQTAGQTTVDGSLSSLLGGTSVTGGTILGAGTVRGNLTAGNATGTAVTINAGDSGKAGLLSITGKYTQLATGNFTGLVNGTTAGTGYSQLKVTGVAALAGTINFTVATAFQSSLTSGETFTVLTGSSVTGTFTNSTIAINSSFHFVVSYTATGVVLTVATGPAAAPDSTPVQSAAIAVAVPRVNTGTSKSPVLTSGLRRHIGIGIGEVGTNRIAKPILVAGIGQSNAHSDLILARTPELNNLRSWEHVPTAPVARPIAVAHVPVATNSNLLHNNIATPRGLTTEVHPIGVRPMLPGWMNNNANQRVPVKTMLPSLPRMTR